MSTTRSATESWRMSQKLSTCQKLIFIEKFRSKRFSLAKGSLEIVFIYVKKLALQVGLRRNSPNYRLIRKVMCRKASLFNVKLHFLLSFNHGTKPNSIELKRSTFITMPKCQICFCKLIWTCSDDDEHGVYQLQSAIVQNLRSFIELNLHAPFTLPS